MVVTCIQVTMVEIEMDRLQLELSLELAIVCSQRGLSI